MSKNATKKILLDHRLAPKKRFGQNFLVQRRTAEAIVACAELNSGDTVIEVGVGLGALTTVLAEKVKNVIGIEIDSGIVRMHQEEKLLSDNVSLIHDDILATDFEELVQRSGGPLKIMANLPYSISNPFIFKLVENRQYLDWAVVMLQKEVAQRLMAKPATKEYGIPTVLLGACARIQKIKTLKPHEFHPQPKVDSVVVRIDFSAGRHIHGRLSTPNFNMLQKVVRACFSKRRKTLLNNLASASLWSGSAEEKPSREDITAAIHDAGLSAEIRAETMTLQQFAALADTINKM